jgi:putative ABC transport system permease protein
MTRMTGWRAAIRIARREARRARGRSALVVAMIALPVAALGFAAVARDTFTLTPAEQADRLMGGTQALVVWGSANPVHQDPTNPDLFYSDVQPTDQGGAGDAAPSTARLLALLPPGTKVLDDRSGPLSVRTVAGTASLRARMLDYTDPLARGILRQRAGRAPADADEVALTPAASRRIGAGVGGTVRTTGGRTLHVVGIVEDPTDLEGTTIVLHDPQPPGTLPIDRGDMHWLVATPGPLTWDQVKRLNSRGVVAISRYVLEHPPSRAEQYPEYQGGRGAFQAATSGFLGGVGLLEIVLLAGPAFAVGARRRRHDLALVAATGGAPAHLRRIVLADGVVLGALAAAGGVALGILAAAAGRPLLEEHVAHFRSGGFRVFPEALAALAVLAVLTGVLAALVPAWIASRQDVVGALAGRRGVTRSRRRWVLLGALLAAAGAGVAATGAARVDTKIIFAGLVAGELGLVLCTPAIVGLVARAGAWLPLAPRIAVRDSSRNRTAAAPAISAVMAAVVGSLAVGVLLTASHQRTRDDYRSLMRTGDVVLDSSGKGGAGNPVPPEALAALRRLVPVVQVHRLGLPSCGVEGVETECSVVPQVPAAADCPYAPWVLRRDPTPAEQRAARRDARCDGLGRVYRYFQYLFTDNYMVVVDPDPAAVAAVTGVSDGDAAGAAAALRAGDAVVGSPRFLDRGRVRLTVSSVSFKNGKDERQRTVTAPGFVLPHPPRVPVLLMTSATARSLRIVSVPSMVLATTSRMPTVAEEDRLRAAVGTRAGVYVERGPRANSDTTTLLVLAVVAGLITLGAAAIATGLAAADGRADLATLAAVGASPRVRRGLSLSQSGVIAGLGSLLGGAAGLGAAVAVLFALNRVSADAWPAPTPYPVAIPWLNVAVALLVVPLVAMLGAGLLTRSRLPIERRL